MSRLAALPTMYLRELVKSLWRQAGLYDRKDARLQSFLQAVDQFPLECWNDFATRFRQDYYDLFDQLVPPLVQSNDHLLRVLLVRQADLTQPKELTLALTHARTADPVASRAELSALLNLKQPEVTKVIRQRTEVTNVLEPPRPKVRPVTNQAKPVAADAVPPAGSSIPAVKQPAVGAKPPAATAPASGGATKVAPARTTADEPSKAAAIRRRRRRKRS